MLDCGLRQALRLLPASGAHVRADRLDCRDFPCRLGCGRSFKESGNEKRHYGTLFLFYLMSHQAEAHIRASKTK